MPYVRTIPTTPGARKRVRTMVNSRPSVNINTRIIRLLSNRLETKRFISDSTIAVTNVDTHLYYVNPFAGITQGAGAANRAGDKVNILDVEFFITYKGSFAGNLDQEWQTSLVKARTSGTYLASSITNYGGATLNYAGFITNGPHNDEEYTMIKQSKAKYYSPLLAPTVTGVGCLTTLRMKHKFKTGGQPIQYVNTTGALNSADYLCLISNMTNGVSGGGNQGNVFVAYIVHYQDA